ncbi:MAG: gamma-glutamyltransferase [Bryobacterales bacterium]|nr:gamma-glutamyltransferase [Bryobacterales bacterium]
MTRRTFAAIPTALLPAPAAGRIAGQGPEAEGNAGVVASEPADSVRAGVRLFEGGGNAFDAAAATCLVTCMMQPHQTDIGGYVCSAVVREAKTGKVWSLDSNSVAPMRARDGMYQIVPKGAKAGINENEYGCSVKDNANVVGPLAVGVPGVMAGIGMLWEKFGRAKWEQVIAPAQEMVDRGFTYREVAGAIAAGEANIRRFEATAQQLMLRGRLPKPDDTWHRPGMDKTLARLARAGYRDFYEGDLARRTVEYVSSLGGILSLDDMKRFQPRVTEPYRTKYRKAAIHSAILANGGLSLSQALNMLDLFEPVADTDPRHWHRLAEVLKLVWRDRLRYLGDDSQAKVPVEKLLSKDHAHSLTDRLRRNPNFVDRTPAQSARFSPGTANITAADTEGNVIAVTISHGGNFGSFLTVPGTGITLGHGMCRFDPHRGLPNSVGPAKRPLNNTCPTIVSMGGRHVAVGQRGGRRIVNVVTEICQRLVDTEQSLLQAVTAPRMHVESQEPADVTESLNPAIVKQLREMGHDIKVVKAVGGFANACEYAPGKPVKGASNVWCAAVSKG